MPLRLSTAVRNSMLSAVSAAVDGGSGAGYVEIRTGAQPATVATAVSGTLLATVPFSDPSFDDPSGGTMAADVTPVPEDSTADATGTAGYFRVFDSAATAVMDGDITATGGGGVMTLNTVALTAGVAFQITSFALTMPAS